MAGDWIKIEHALPDKPEVCQLAEILGIDQDAATGKLLRFWIWCDQQTVSGNALTVTKSFLDRITYHTGFADGLIKVGWLTSRDNNGCLELSVPRFDRHNGQTAKDRANTNRRVAKTRDLKRECNAETVTSVTLEPLQKPLPEKRREEKIEEKRGGREEAPPPVDSPETLIPKINSLKPSWLTAPHLTQPELYDLHKNRIGLEAISETDWETLRAWTESTEGKADWLMKTRSRFLTNYTEALMKAKDWQSLGGAITPAHMSLGGRKAYSHTIV